MSSLEKLVALDRLRHRGPLNLAAGARRLTSSALQNARQASEVITTAVVDRRILAQSLDSASEPGNLLRLTRTECRELLASRSVGHLAYIARAGVPDIVPVNYEMDGDALLIRSAPGPKLQAAERGDVVAFEVDDIDEDRRTGWSVVVIGRARSVVTGYDGTSAPTPWARGPRRHMIRIEPRRVEGRRLL